MMAAQARKTRTGSRWPQRNSSGRQPVKVYSSVFEDQSSENPENVAASRKLFQTGPGVSPESVKQPPAAPATTEAASVHLARWAPHPSADTVPGTEPSPRMPALVTMPPRQKLVDEATSVRALSPVADPSSLPVAELDRRRAATPGRETWLAGQAFISSGVAMGKGKGRGDQPRNTRPSLGEGVRKPLQGDLLQRGVGFAKLAD